MSPIDLLTVVFVFGAIGLLWLLADRNHPTKGPKP